MEDTHRRNHGLLPVAGGHQIWWEESGSPEGIPALYLHGGPGGTLGSGGYRKKFDQQQFRVIGIDQRGCGRSRPLACTPGYDLGENTTQHLIQDIEAVRQHLGVERWLLNGVSWGSTLALAYAQAFPARVLGVVLMAVTTTSRFEVDWITEGVGAVFPEAWDRFAGYAEGAGIGYHRGRQRIVEAYLRLLQDSDPQVQETASQEWALWEDSHISLGAEDIRRDPRWENPEYRHSFATLVTHYWSHDGFLDPPILARMEELAGIPATLIHGRQDISGPLITAWRLHQAWPGSELIIHEREGHGGHHMVEEWAAANQRHAERILRQRG